MGGGDETIPKKYPAFPPREPKGKKVNGLQRGIKRRSGRGD